MKAALFREYSKDPEKVVRIEDVDMPKLKPTEVMIKQKWQGTIIMIFGPFGENLSKFRCPISLGAMWQVVW